ncbi:MAG: maltotransferase domain-containing protein [Candidatus Nanopelagicales bacterium]
MTQRNSPTVPEFSAAAGPTVPDSVAKKAPAKTPAKKATAKKPAAPAKKTAAKATPAKRPAAPAKKTAGPAKKATAKKATAKKATAKKASAPKNSSAGATTRQAPAHAATTDVPSVLTGRFPVTDVSPTVESGRRPAKAVVGEQIPVRATAFREGHDLLGVEVVLRDAAGREHQRRRMLDLGTGLDQWGATVSPDSEGLWSFAVESWGDPWATWLHRADIKIPAGIDIELELAEGALLLERARADLSAAVTTMRNAELPPAVRLAAVRFAGGLKTGEGGHRDLAELKQAMEELRRARSD